MRELTRTAACEFVLLAVLMPLVCADMSVEHSDHLWCSDASDDKLAGCWAPCGQGVHRALWPHRERRGHYTWLPKGAAKWLEQRAPDSVRQDHWEHVGTAAPFPQRVLIECFDFVAVCCGAKGVLPASMAYSISFCTFDSSSVGSPVSAKRSSVEGMSIMFEPVPLKVT